MIKNINHKTKRFLVGGLLLVSLVGTNALGQTAPMVKDKTPDTDYEAKVNFKKVDPVKFEANKKEQPQLALDVDSSTIFKDGKNVKIKVEPGLSNHEIEKIEQKKKELAEKEAQEKARQEKLAQQREQKVKAVQTVQRDRRTNFTKLYQQAGRRFGIPWQILAAVHSVETGQSGNTTISSYAGARGPMQFIPSTWYAYAVDGDGNGVASIYDVDDAVHTAARYLAANGGQSNIRGALYHYNHSNYYVNKVIGIARGWGYSG